MERGIQRFLLSILGIRRSRDDGIVRAGQRSENPEAESESESSQTASHESGAGRILRIGQGCESIVPRILLWPAFCGGPDCEISRWDTSQRRAMVQRSVVEGAKTRGRLYSQYTRPHARPRKLFLYLQVIKWSQMTRESD